MKSKLLKKLRKQVSKDIYVYYEDSWWLMSYVSECAGRREWRFMTENAAEKAALVKIREQILYLLKEYKKKRLKHLHHYYPW